MDGGTYVKAAERVLLRLSTVIATTGLPEPALRRHITELSDIQTFSSHGLINDTAGDESHTPKDSPLRVTLTSPIVGALTGLIELITGALKVRDLVRVP